MSNSLRSLIPKDQLWENRWGCSPKMINHERISLSQKQGICSKNLNKIVAHYYKYTDVLWSIFFVLTLQPYSTVSFNTIFLIQINMYRNPCVSAFKGKKRNCSIFVFFLQKVEKRLYTVETLLKIKIIFSLITCERVEIFQKQLVGK